MTMQRYMNGMGNGGSIFSRDNSTPLTNEELAAVVPSLFATEAHESRSDRFVPIPTVNVLDGLRAADFVPVFAQQARTRIEGKELFTRHMLRLRHRSLTNNEGRAFEIILTNANDGTSAYKMIAGIFRFVCLNGLFTGDTFAPVHVRHSGKTVIDQVRDGALQILDMAPRALEQVDRFKGIKLDRSEAMVLADASHMLRFPKAYTTDPDNPESRPVLNPDRAPVQPVDLLRARRTDDRHPTLWHALNIIQENVVKGGQRGHVVNDKGQVKRQKVRAVNGIGQAESLNCALWTITEGMAAIKEAA
jgi:hypothetical protein